MSGFPQPARAAIGYSQYGIAVTAAKKVSTNQSPGIGMAVNQSVCRSNGIESQNRKQLRGKGKISKGTERKQSAMADPYIGA